MIDFKYVAMWAIGSALIFLLIGIFFRKYLNLRARPIHLHHAYVGAAIVIIALVVDYMIIFKQELIGIGIGLIISDIIHHQIYNIKF